MIDDFPIGVLTPETAGKARALCAMSLHPLNFPTYRGDASKVQVVCRTLGGAKMPGLSVVLADEMGQCFS